jgi:hypothetical protein
MHATSHRPIGSSGVAKCQRVSRVPHGDIDGKSSDHIADGHANIVGNRVEGPSDGISF